MESFDLSDVIVWRAVERLLGLVIGGGTIYFGVSPFYGAAAALFG
jgi:hypothetical protein